MLLHPALEPQTL